MCAPVLKLQPEIRLCPVVLQKHRGVIGLAGLFGIAVREFDPAVLQQSGGDGFRKNFSLRGKEAIFLPESEMTGAGIRWVIFWDFRRLMKPDDTSLSRIPARVAGVPRPFRSASSGISFAPAVSIAARRVPSV